MIIHRVENFTKGIIDSVEAKSIPAGAASRSLNWMTMGDHIELRRGYKRMGADDGIGKVTGVFTAHKVGGGEVMFKTYATKLVFYNAATELFIEVGSDIIPAGADGEDVTMDEIETFAGAQLWLNSPLGIFYKVMLNKGDSTIPPSEVSQADANLNFSGWIKIQLNRIKLWGRAKDKTGLNLSFIDARTYTTVSAEAIGTGNGATKDYTATLAFKAAGAKRTCFSVSVTDGTETFADDRNGTLTGSAGGYGTINYATGAVVIHFNANVTNLQSITATYQWEDSTVDGIADFGHSTPRVAGEGEYFPQGDGGAIKTVASYKDNDYCLHEFKVFRLVLTDDDTNAENRVWRDNIGVQSLRGACPTGDGVFFVDARNSNDVKVRLIKFDVGSSEDIPISISEQLDLSDYRFDDAVLFEFGDFILIGCRTSDSVDSNNAPVNNMMLVYNRLWKAWDVLDYRVRDCSTFDGALMGGHSMDNNVYELFSGFDDDGSKIPNYWEGNLDEMKITELKKSRKLRVEGDIGPDQIIRVSLSLDNGPSIVIGDIEGGAAYVDTSQSVNIGSQTLGKKVIGAGSDGAIAYHYLREFDARRIIGKFQRAKIRFEALEIGYAGVSNYEHFDITRHGPKLPSRYNV